ncbi:AbrB family transcriptional regulator [Anaerorhabdus sp.]|uniref:AbrB family transcriptional regulator n=1 Tax=Anaerorhabdus sp. TaxID=1872524 RepID=UPI003A880E58
MAAITALHAIAALAGYLTLLAGVPLPWMIGPILVASIATPIVGANGSTVPLRMLGQLVIGAAMGFSLSPSAFERIISASIPIALAALLTVVTAIILGWLQARFLKLDTATAIYSSVPGGPVDMALLAEHQGGDPGRTALAQTIRLVLIIALFPQLLLYLGATNYSHRVSLVDLTDLLPLFVLLGACVLAGIGARFARVLNPFFVGPLLFVGVLSTSGMSLPPVPDWLVAFAQILLGVSIGSLFQRDLYRSGITTIALACATMLLLFSLCTGIAWAIHLGFDLDLRTMLIATAPGGATEMAVTAQAMELDVPLVVAFQIVRVIVIATLLPLIFITFKKLLTR